MKIFNLPDLGEGLPDAAIVTWHVKEGDYVKVDQLLVSVETAKAIVEVPSPEEGVIEKLCGQPKDLVKTGQPLVVFKDQVINKDKNEDKDKNIELDQDAGTVVGNIKAAPAVRALARKLNIDLNKIIPTGPANTVIKEDVERSIGNISRLATVENNSEEMDWQIVDNTTRSMAIAMQQSLAEVVPATIFEDLILTNADSLDITVKLIQAIGIAGGLEPTLNAWFKKDHNNNFKQKIFKEINLGIAVDSKEGLFVPVINNIAAKSSDELRAELKLLRQQIDARTISLEKLQYPTFILSNIGKFTGRYATPVILSPTVAILAVGELRKMVVALDEQIVVRDCLPLSLTFDHRAVTGGQAARFLKAILQFCQKTSNYL